MVDPKATLARDRLGQWRDRFLVEVFDGAAGGANQVMVMTRLTPHVGRDVPRSLESLRQAGGDQRVERAKHGGPADVGMLLAHPLVQLLRRGLLPRLRQHRGDGEPLGRQPDAGLLQRGLGACLNHTQMILLSQPIPSPACGGQGGDCLVGEDGRDVHLSAIDGGADADLAEMRPQNVVAMFR